MQWLQDIEDVKSKLEKERQNFFKALSKSSKECENLLKNESAKFQAIYEKFIKEKATHLPTLKDVVNKYEEEKEKLFTRYEELAYFFYHFDCNEENTHIK